ncbi:MAG: CDP-diacylglycerol--glycerol-3-phosphate 3-phosphatidyltransferase [Candidatus Muirbacterium halophilum]|nr:CDP-diacylglycerol--glycerol-3-phosphate 3-phosphatidyltransferase [Candidatus Muirbacterium halophilum]MCK9476427.1 CDP-diacylglycerol--glycerol-3-phosphate 3-phosphatidyltransferase [Candidatus Muirbacterium halophilum]
MNIADKLTFFRLGIVPFLILFFVVDTFEYGLAGDYLKIISCILFILGAISDGMDGYYARKYKLVSNAGKLWDPVADKILVCSTLILLSSTSFIPFYMTVIIVARELFVSGIRLVSIERGKLISASSLGKWKTGFQLGYIITVMVFISFEILMYRFIPQNFEHITDYFIKYRVYIYYVLEIITLYFTIVSGYHYYKNYREDNI